MWRQKFKQRYLKETLTLNNASCNFMKNSERGVSLIITFFILVIILAVVLSISVILYSEIKIIRNIGDSVVAFYAADSGVEKTLYYDRQVVPPGATGGKRGVCSMCDELNRTCPANDSNMITNCGCQSNTGENCGPENCENCTITFNTTLSTSPQKTYSVTAVVSQELSPANPASKFSKLSIYSTGSYAGVLGSNEVERAVQLDVWKDETGSMSPEFIASAMPFAVDVADSTGIAIKAENINAFGRGIKSAKAYIQGYDRVGGTIIVDEWEIFPPDDGHYLEAGTYTIQYIGPIGVYFVDVEVCNNNSNCSTVSIDNI